jgi:hypothetical protein
MGLEEEVGIPGDLGRGAPDEAGGVLIDGGGEWHFHVRLGEVEGLTCPASAWDVELEDGAFPHPGPLPQGEGTAVTLAWKL